ncbi:MAG: glycerol-3-phosphate dehydrogenase/oxidase [Deltaproteobacteria bacterium]|nr:glycerol-3-phosphate dehydrogenase/oxidase [Deltaproteobacteria bacterium]MBW2413509.1 glycerol-3-phosphate dehydrogenase/oxidase [Deltaproteobacteria bacterium]
MGQSGDAHDLIRLPALPAERRAALRELESREFDLAIIGGGITGAGISRAASLRGLSVAVLEAEDFASGTSSRSSKLIHGGLRYLAMGDVALVRESALERKAVHRLAPHLAEPRWMVLPTRGRASLLKFQMAIVTYEKLGAVEDADLHENWDAAALEREEPLLLRDRWRYACAYREYLTDDARLVLANLRGAVRAGAVAVNHLAVTAMPVESGRIVGVEARCSESGAEVRVRARCVVNAAGPWVEAVRRLAQPEVPDWLHLSKGVHVGLPIERLPVRNMVVMTTADRRTIFVIPRDGVVYVGTTDTSYPAGAEIWPAVTRADVEYLLAPLAEYFSVDPFTPDDVVCAWSGLRPLIAEPGKKAKDLSRKDEIHIGESGLVSIAGGKLTGYRPMAENALEKVATVLGTDLPPRRAADDPALPGGDFEGSIGTLAESLAGETGLSQRAALRLARLYGTESRGVVGENAAEIAPGSGVLEGEIDWAVRCEGAATLEDAIYRRLRLPLYEPGALDPVLGPAADRMAALLGWDAARRDAEVSSVRERAGRDLRFEESSDG